jgi:hypothetical protein
VLPTELALPHDLVCAGTAWSAGADGSHRGVSPDRVGWTDGRRQDG